MSTHNISFHIICGYPLLPTAMPGDWQYSKCPKILYTKISDKMAHANSAYPDQTAPCSFSSCQIRINTVCHSTMYLKRKQHKKQNLGQNKKSSDSQTLFSKENISCTISTKECSRPAWGGVWVETATSWLPVGRASHGATEAGLACKKVSNRVFEILGHLPYHTNQQHNGCPLSKQII